MGRLKLKPRRTAAHQTGKTPMSRYISELIKPYFQGDAAWLHERASLSALGHIAGLAWNLSRVERVDDTTDIEDKARAEVVAMGGEGVFDELLGRARAMGPRENRLITNVTVTVEGEDVKIVATSAGW